MIFRTINADAKKLTEQFGLLNKSFRDIKKDFANGLGFKNSLFQTSISKTDYQALQKFNSAIKVTNDGLTKSQRITKAWNENMSGCSIAAKRMGNDLVTGKKNIQDISKAMNTASGSTKDLGVAMNVMANVGFMLAITAITKVISELAQAQDNAAQAAKEATETYKSELDSIADYKQRLSELHEELKSGNLSYEETKTKRTELMTIQDELIEKFGTEEDAIKSVTDAVKGEVDALDDLNEKAYRDWVAKADEQTFWNKLLPGGKSGLDQAIDYMESEKTVSFYDMQNANLSDELQAIQKEIDETIRAKYNLDKTFAMFNVTGTPDELRTQLENIRQDYIDISKKIFAEKNIPDHGMWKEYQKETTDSINEAITSLDKGLEKHQDTYRTYIEGLIKYDSEYSDEYANILQKRAELESAQNSGNAEEVKRAKQEFMDSINDAIIASDSDESIKKYFESLYPELQAEFNNWAFEFDLKANVKGLEDTAKEIGEKYTATDLLNMVDTEGVQEGEESFNSLIDKAIEYGVCTDKSAEEVQKLIDLLVELGIVQGNVTNSSSVDKTSQQLKTLKETYKSASEDVTALTTALSESVSGTGLSSDSVDAVTSMFSDLKGYDEDKLLDKTANGLRLNTRELEKLKKEYDDNTAKEFYNNVEDAYNAWQDALRNGEEQSVVDRLYDQYQQAAQLADQYVGLTSAYNKWQDALSTANEGEMYDSIYNNIKSVKELYKKGLIGTDDFRTYVDLISPKDLAGATTEEVVKAYQQSIGKIERYFTDGHKGAENFLNDVQKINSEWAHMNKDGSWEIDFGAGGSSDKDVAKRLGIDVEALQAILRKLVDYGFDIDFGNSLDSLAMMEKSADKAYDKLKKLGKIGKKTKIKFDTGDISEVNKQITKAEKVLDKFRDKDGNLDLSIDGAAEAQSVLIKLLTEKQELEKPAILKVNTSELSGKSASVISMLQKIQQDINTYDVKVAVGADTTDAEKKIKEDIKAAKDNYGKELSDIHINLDNINSAREELQTLTKEDIDVMVNAIINHKEVDAYKKEKEEKTLKVTTEVDDKAVNEFMAKTLEKTIKIKAEVESDDIEIKTTKSKKSKDNTKSANSNTSKKDNNSKADGTFNTLKDTLSSHGFANASGNISIPKNQTALVNELGEELIVRDGRWFTVKGGAQFTELKKGDIVFNHMQTRQLLKNGKITSSDNRGKMAYSGGTTGSGIPGWTYSSTSSDKKDSKKSSKKSKKSESDKKDSKQLIDWIERKLDVLQDKIDLTKAKFDNLFSVKRQKNNLNNQIEKTTKLLNAQGKAVTKYQKKADSIKLSDSLKKKVRNGDIKGNLSELIREYGEKTAKQISKYQDYIDKVKDAKKAVAELKAEIKDLSKQKLDLKLEDNERKRTYQEARYANATSADEKRKILNKEINTYKSDDKEYAEYYKESKKQRKKDGNTAKKAVNNTKGLGKSAKQKIKKLIKQGKEIPSTLMKKVKKHSTATYQKLLDYNNSVDFAADVLRDKKLANEQNETSMREKRIERAQNYADEAEAKYNLNQQYEANAVSAKDKNKYETKSLKYLNKQYDKLIKIAELEGDVTEQKRLQAEKQEKNKESYQTMYDNIKTEYDNKTGLNGTRISTIQSEIATLEAAGQSASKAMYDGMMKINEGTKEKLLKERAELEEAGRKFEYGSEEWFAWQNDMESIDQSLYSCTQQTIEFQKAINELDFKKFSLIASQLDATKSHLDFLVDMLSHDDLTNKDAGGLTDAGFATISLRFANMDNNAKIRENAQAELAKLHEDHINGKDFRTEEEYLAYEKELEDTIRDTYEADADEKDAILDLVENAMQVQIDAIDELIEKKKKALATEKDYKKELYANYLVIQFLF